MQRRACVIPVLLMLGLLSVVGCAQRSTAPPKPQKLQVTVSIPPQKYFVERIGNGYVTVNVMVPPGAEPHTFEPKPEQLKAISRSSAYLRIQMDFEQAWMDKFIAANPKMLIVDTTQGIQRLPLAGGLQGQEKTSAAHPSENLDPHIWLSPRLVKVQAQTIYTTLAQLDPTHKAAYQANLQQFLSDIDALDQEIHTTLKGVKNRKFIVFHPSWGYFARDYQLEQIPIEVGGQEPSAAELAALIVRAKQDQIKVVFAEPQFSQKTADTIAKEIGGEVLLIDPLSPNWATNLRTVAQTFSRVLSQTLLKLGQVP